MRPPGETRHATGAAASRGVRLKERVVLSHIRSLGEATKTVPFVQDSRKLYRFTVRWGVETDSDDSDGAVVATSPDRPSAIRWWGVGV